MNVVIYIRVSTKDQSLDAQRDLCREYATKCNYNVVNIIEEICSAYNGQCKQIKLVKLLNDIKYNKISINKIIVSMYDRFCRNINFAINAISILNDSNVTLESAIGNIPNSGTPLGMKLMLYAFVDAQYESALIGERVRIMKEYKKKNGSNVSICEEIHKFVNFVRNTKDIHGNELLLWIEKLRNHNGTLQDDDVDVTTECENETEKWKSFDTMTLKKDVIYNSITYHDIASILNKYGIPNDNGNKWTSQELLKINRQKNIIKNTNDANKRASSVCLLKTGKCKKQKLK